MEGPRKDACRDCRSPLEIFEIDEMRGTKVTKCPKCGMLHVYKRDILGQWRMLKAQKPEFAPILLSGVETLIKESSFLRLDANWSDATVALQMQEVATILVARKKGILLGKADVEKTLGKKLQELSFNDRYEAFSIQVKNLYNVDMPILTGHLRKMRTKVLHEGYNPQPEETESIVSFTKGLLQKLKRITSKAKRRRQSD